jgi:hypothetical protein
MDVKQLNQNLIVNYEYLIIVIIIMIIFIIIIISISYFIFHGHCVPSQENCGGRKYNV